MGTTPPQTAGVAGTLTLLARLVASFRELHHNVVHDDESDQTRDEFDAMLARAQGIERELEVLGNELAGTATHAEPWSISRKIPHLLSDANGDAVAEFDGSVDDLPRDRDVTNARRVVACVNACAALGIPTADLELLASTLSPKRASAS